MKKNGIRKKLLKSAVMVISITIFLTTAIKTVSDIAIRNYTDKILIEQARDSAEVFAQGQAKAINEQITALVEKLEDVSEFAEYLYGHPDEFVLTHNKRPSEFSPDTTGVTFHWSAFTKEDVSNPDIIAEADMLSALESRFYSLTRSCSMVQSLYVATNTHINIGYDENVLAKVGGYYNPAKSGAQWYLQPIETGKFYISDAYSDTFNRGLMVTISVPYSVDGAVRGVIGADIGLERLEKTILNIDMSGMTGYAALLSANAQPLAAKGIDENTTAKDILGSNYAQIINEVKNAASGCVQTNIDGEEKYVVFDTIDITGWRLAVIISVDKILAPTKSMDKLIESIAFTSIAISAIILAVVLFHLSKYTKKFTKPVIDLTKEVEKIGDGNFEYVSNINTADEIEILSKKFENMTVSLKEYIHNLTLITAEKERIGAELSVATEIQASMLPNIFPAFPHRTDFDIFATMSPAKEVGGDFYDFFMVDENHIATVMADVSGKGVPAALFMVIAKTLIKDHTEPGLDLADVFSRVNDILCESNSGELFVTAFEGVLALDSGEFRFVNAGHEPPFISRNGGDYEMYKIKPGFVLAGMENIKYKSGCITLNPGDKIFEYTDGVTEAIDKNNNFYTFERLNAILNKNADKAPAELLPLVKKDIDLFANGAAQFDDITMLCLEYKGRGDKN